MRPRGRRRPAASCIWTWQMGEEGKREPGVSAAACQQQQRLAQQLPLRRQCPTAPSFRKQRRSIKLPDAFCQARRLGRSQAAAGAHRAVPSSQTHLTRGWVSALLLPCQPSHTPQTCSSRSTSGRSDDGQPAESAVESTCLRPGRQAGEAAASAVGGEFVYHGVCSHCGRSIGGDQETDGTTASSNSSSASASAGGITHCNWCSDVVLRGGWMAKCTREHKLARAADWARRRAGGRFAFKIENCNFGLVRRVMLDRGWEEAGAADGSHNPGFREWDCFWGSLRAGVELLRFTRSLAPWQRVNHFRTSKELCRKDLLHKNIKKWQSHLVAAGRTTEAKGYDFVPTTFVLPQEYALFAEEFRTSGGGPWIMKPVGSSEGRGIFLLTHLGQARSWRNRYLHRHQVGACAAARPLVDAPSARAKAVAAAAADMPPIVSAAAAVCSDKALSLSLEEEEQAAAAAAAESVQRAVREGQLYVAQRYLGDPLLLGGRKFDLRLYVFVASFRPLTVYLYRNGFARVAQTLFSTDPAALDNATMHLTNVAVQRRGSCYDGRRGGKLCLDKFKACMIMKYGLQATDQLLLGIQKVVIRSLVAVQRLVISDSAAFELYGYDVMVDAHLRPWLLEVNASPSLACSTAEDGHLKYQMISDALDILDVEGMGQGVRGESAPLQMGGFDLVYHKGYVELGSQCGWSSCLGSVRREHWKRQQQQQQQYEQQQPRRQQCNLPPEHLQWQHGQCAGLVECKRRRPQQTCPQSPPPAHDTCHQQPQQQQEPIAPTAQASPATPNNPQAAQAPAATMPTSPTPEVHAQRTHARRSWFTYPDASHWRLGTEGTCVAAVGGAGARASAGRLDDAYVWRPDVQERSSADRFLGYSPVQVTYPSDCTWRPARWERGGQCDITAHAASTTAARSSQLQQGSGANCQSASVCGTHAPCCCG